MTDSMAELLRDYTYKKACMINELVDHGVDMLLLHNKTIAELDQMLESVKAGKKDQ